MKKLKSKNIVETPRGLETGSQPIEGFQIIQLEDFIKNKNIPDSTKESYHALPFDLIIIFIEGSGVHHIDFKAYKFEAPAILMLRKGQYHAWDLSRKMKGYLLFFEVDFKFKLGNEAPLIHIKLPQITPKFPILNALSSVDNDLVINLCGALYEEFAKEIQANKLLQTYLSALLTKIEAEVGSLFALPIQLNEYKVFEEFLQLLDTQIQTSRNGNFYCNALNLRYDELNKISKNITGFTLKQYIDEFILTKAKRYLYSSKDNISQISYQLGFQDVGNFSKYFKNKSGLSPLGFRKSLNHI